MEEYAVAEASLHELEGIDEALLGLFRQQVLMVQYMKIGLEFCTTHAKSTNA